MDQQHDGRQTRRTLLLGAAGAAAALAGGLFHRVTPVAAADGGNVILGSTSNTASKVTEIVSSGSPAFSGTGPIGVQGATTSTAATAAGVYGRSSTNGNYGVLSSGKLGVVGPIELTSITLTQWTLPGSSSGRSFLFITPNASGALELRVRFPSGVVRTIATA